MESTKNKVLTEESQSMDDNDLLGSIILTKTITQTMEIKARESADPKMIKREEIIDATNAVNHI